jgi:hypothetical protein
MFLSSCMKKSLPARCFIKAGLISSACRVEFTVFPGPQDTLFSRKSVTSIRPVS